MSQIPLFSSAPEDGSGTSGGQPYNPGRMRVATWNVNGIRARHEQFLQWVSETKPDVVCLQEIKAKIE